MASKRKGRSARDSGPNGRVVRWLGILLILAFADRLRWLPSSGDGTWRHMIMPGFTLALYSIGLVSRLVRTTLIDILQQDYIRTARAKGLFESRVMIKHALRNALIPVITIIGPLFAALITGSMVVEQIFAIPGLGRYFVDSVSGRDYPVIMGTTLLFAALLVISNLIVDISYSWIDPRIRLDES